ncbi:pisatin demethylase [Apodospora peruviana]|uniref:Pisatin demethylase n=1 Tax=Apodospora peruviana TaxID=516989 RepID=A0AAE0HTT9_9PEZI|nr:pisatin demethylase [Apodospora peruviana]
MADPFQQARESISRIPLPHINFTTAALTTLTAFLLWYTTTTIIQYRKLSHIPGPTLASLSLLWLLRTSSSTKAHLEFFDVTKKYGSIARIGPNVLLTDDPDLLRRMWAVRSDYKRSRWYKSLRLNPKRDSVVSTIDEELHNTLRAKLAAGYSGREVDGLEARLDRNILDLVGLIETKYMTANKPFDFGRKIQYLTLDILSDIGFSDRFGFLEADADLWEYLETLEKNFPTAMMLTVLPWVVELLGSPLLASLMPSDKDPIGIGRMIGVTNEMVAKRYVVGDEKKVVKRDMLGSFVNHGLTRDEAESETVLQVVAGSDTTAGAIRHTMLYILTNPRVMESMRREIDSHKLSWPVVTDAEARDMPYLQAVIREGLRMKPPITGVMLKDSPEQGDTWKGVYIPPGTKVGACVYGLLRREDIFGDDPEQFRPERWLEATPEKRLEMEGAVELIFSYGRFKCLGRNIAAIELNKTFVELIRRFDFAIVDPEKPWKSRNAGIFLINDFWMRAYPRAVQTT